ncbi:heavy-metal-associated domain-containing protein [Streptomyces halobius]|uniref:Cation transporter n=1 Tax=Streptomyces halobius TaxID=2879846 RepID=A0ABY4M107_9ACTN|nr:heavy metal-associated domain-containing protein [Streptomyces halobius]UQA91147.1 cation transporter [Streptomyces halobius]
MSDVITLSVPGVSCGCRQALKGAVGALPGVSIARVDLAARTVTAVYGRAAVLPGIVAAVEAAGYQIAGYEVGSRVERMAS